ncbi:rhodanese-like domain-containing protein [uncultured Adlercreutzia sp.]|uniref:rhodanese-like domain-containing protein n=1 Tax=uncultured Adlercreutzia sp. TaxID=875803 RepID=UPI0026F39610|nr:rhodanese-like domain-containing protein [uncultured Adlercreutzia sp.]
MGMFDFMRGPSIDEGVREYRDTEGAVLLDVRTPQEFAEGRVPGSVNIPLQELNRVAAAVPDPATPLFVYCLSGGRSGQAVSALQSAGYTTVKNIGGMSGYTGEVER